MSKNSGLYETDFYAWTIEQAKFLKDGVWDCLDISNLVEEIESLGKQQRQELRNRRSQNHLPKAGCSPVFIED
ncbi:MAG TPA: DUF29 family protein [Coleofasciculaceae cyanobacterium]